MAETPFVTPLATNSETLQSATTQGIESKALDYATSINQLYKSQNLTHGRY